MNFIEEKNNKLHVKKVDMKADYPLCNDLKEPLNALAYSGRLTGICGYSGSGKTSLLVNILSNKKVNGERQSLRECFHNIYICSPSLHTLKNNIFEDIPQEYKTEQLTNEFLQKIYDDAEERKQDDDIEHSLVVFDDVGNELRDKDTEKLFNKLIANRRHMNISIIIIVQALKMMNPKSRTNLNVLISFRPKSIQEREAIYEYTERPKKLINDFYNFFFPENEKHNFLFIDMTLKDTNAFKFYKNYNRIKF
tara:strand:+ start:4092 stop:4844 length:753 start_codon:yes stop_codon:yes gene_type:complete